MSFDFVLSVFLAFNCRCKQNLKSVIFSVRVLKKLGRELLPVSYAREKVRFTPCLCGPLPTVKSLQSIGAPPQSHVFPSYRSKSTTAVNLKLTFNLVIKNVVVVVVVVVHRSFIPSGELRDFFSFS